MRKNEIFENKECKPIASDQVLKATSLLYFEDALYSERYEDCPELIRMAKRFGARQHEVSSVIAKYNRGAGAGRKNGVKKNGGRLRFY